MPSINRLERLQHTPRLQTLWDLQSAFEQAGVSFKEREEGYALEIEERVVDELLERLESGAAVTSRGKISGSHGGSLDGDKGS